MWTTDLIREHEARVGQLTVFYTFTFDLGGDFSFGRAVQKLLKSGIVETMAIPILNDVHLAPRYKELATTISGAESLIEVAEWLEHEKKFRDLSWRARRLLVTSSLSVVPRILRSSIGSTGRDEGQEERQDVRSMMRSVIEEINESVDNSRLYIGIQSAVDRDLYEPGYLARVPFVRFELRQFKYSNFRKLLTLSDEKESEFEDTDAPAVTMLLHDSGVVLLTIGMRLGLNDKDHSLSEVQRPSAVKFAFSLISEPILEAASRFVNSPEKNWAGDWISEIHEGVRWRSFDHTSSNVSLTDIFDLYHDAIITTIGSEGRLTDWMCYPTVFVDNLRCCKNKKRWIRRHRGELLRYLAGPPSSPEVDHAKIFDADYSSDPATTILLSGGGTFCVNWEFGEPTIDLPEYFRWTSVTENALMRYWQLRQLDFQVSEVKDNAAGLESLMRRTVAGMRDYRHPYMPTDASGEVSRAITSKLGAEEYARSIESRIATLHALVSMKETVRSARRANRLAAAAVLLAMILAFPAIHETLDLISKIPRKGPGGEVAAVLIHAGATPGNAWVIFFIFIFMVLLVAIPMRLAKLRRIRRLTRKKLDLTPNWNNKPFRVEIVPDSAPE